MDQLSDEQLIKLFQDGNEGAYVQLVNNYKDRLYNFLYGIIRDVASAEDLAQETFLKVFTHKDSYKGPYKFSTWMYTIGKNLAFTELRKIKRRKTRSFSDIEKTKGEDWGGMQIPDPTDPIDDEMSNEEKSRIIQKGICQLPEDFMIVIIFRDIQELSYEDISTILEVPIGTVKSRINRGREKLRQLLKEKGIYLNES